MFWALALLIQQQAPRDTLGAIEVTVTRHAEELARVPAAVSVVQRDQVSKARPTQGLDESMSTVAGVYASDRYNFSLDQRVAIRGAGARSSFGIRGIKVLLDDIPQTLSDGTGQLTNVDFGLVDRIEVMRGPGSALYGNASGGVISLHTDQAPPPSLTEAVTVSGGSSWNKWLSQTRLPLGGGALSVGVSRLDYGGARQHSSADFRNLDTRWVGSVGRSVLALTADYGDDPRADNPGALTAKERAANPDSAAAINITKAAGKAVSQFQGGASLRRALAGGGSVSLALFGFARTLKNPQTFAYIDLDRVAYGARGAWSHPFSGRAHAVLTAGVDVQQQRDSRLNVGNQAGKPDTVRQLDQLEHVTEAGPFAQLTWNGNERTSFTAGARYDWVRFAVDDRLITPTNPDDSGHRIMQAPSGFFGGTYRINPSTIFYANVGTSFETPTTTELANRPDTAGGFNQSLNPQHAVSYEAGVRGGPARLRYAVTGFRAHVQGALIPFAIPASAGRVFYQNSGRSLNQGIELEATAQPVRALTLRAAWTFSDFRYVAYTASGHVLDGRRLPGIPENWVHVLWTLRPRLFRGGWLEVQQTYSSGFYVDDTLATRTQPWHALDLRAGWDGGAGRIGLAPFVALNNVLDRRYASSVVINAAGGRYYEPAPGRNAYIGLTLSAR